MPGHQRCHWYSGIVHLQYSFSGLVCPWYITVLFFEFLQWRFFLFVFVVCPFLQSSKQLRPLLLWKMSIVVFILTSALTVSSLPSETEKGRRKVVHVLGKGISHFHVSNNCYCAKWGVWLCLKTVIIQLIMVGLLKGWIVSIVSPGYLRLI